MVAKKIIEMKNCCILCVYSLNHHIQYTLALIEQLNPISCGFRVVNIVAKQPILLCCLINVS